MNWCLVAFCFAVVISNVECYNDDRIVIGGTPSPKGTFKFLPQLIFPRELPSKDLKSGKCSSTIISKRHILTAAHCVVDDSYPNPNNTNHMIIKRPTLVFVRHSQIEKRIFPSINISDHAIATRIYFHPNYKGHRHLSDVAIVEFPEGTQIEADPVILINDYQPKDGDYGVAAGYGRFRNKSGLLTNSMRLRNATVPIFTAKTCHFKNLFNMMCTGHRNRMASKGDSGGPLMINQNETFYQIGIVSWGGGAERKKGVAHAIYSPTSTYCPWIEKVTKNETKCQPLPKSTPLKLDPTTPDTVIHTKAHRIQESTPSFSTQATVRKIQTSTKNLLAEAQHGNESNNCNSINVNIVFAFVMIFMSFLY